MTTQQTLAQAFLQSAQLLVSLEARVSALEEATNDTDECPPVPPGYESYFTTSSRMIEDFGLTHDIIQTVLLDLGYSPSTAMVDGLAYFNTEEVDEAFERFYDECTMHPATFSHDAIKGTFGMAVM